jgi:hypothetical protein
LRTISPLRITAKYAIGGHQDTTDYFHSNEKRANTIEKQAQHDPWDANSCVTQNAVTVPGYFTKEGEHLRKSKVSELSATTPHQNMEDNAPTCKKGTTLNCSATIDLKTDKINTLNPAIS